MILEVRHRTHYRYASTAVLSQHLLRLTPRSGPGQRVQVTTVSISPEPDDIDRHTDMFGNVVHVATVSRPHDELEILAVARVDRAERDALIFAASAPWEETRNATLGIAGASPVAELAPFAFPSQMTAPDRLIEAYARESLASSQASPCWSPPRRSAAASTATSPTCPARPPPTPCGARRSGCARASAKISRTSCWRRSAACACPPATSRAICSGYLRTRPPEGSPRLVGADASHAWVSIWDPGLGGIDFDPTNDCLPGEDHVALAIGRDYGDVAPVSGVVVGAGQQRLSVGVDVLAAAPA